MAKHFGSITSGTLNVIDLLKVYTEYLEENISDFIDPIDKHTLRTEIDTAKVLLQTDAWLTDNDLAESDAMEACHAEAGEMVNEAFFDRLCELALPYMYFGAHPEDGSDFGFWVDRDMVQTDVREGELLDWDSLTIDDGNSNCHAIEVNDHGNVTLWWLDEEGIRSEVWAVV